MQPSRLGPTLRKPDLCPAFEWLKQDGRLSLDHFIAIKIFIIAIKRSRLVLGHDVRVSNGLAIEWLGLA
jgi:hypothetical protein